MAASYQLFKSFSFWDKHPTSRSSWKVMIYVWSELPFSSSPDLTPTESPISFKIGSDGQDYYSPFVATQVNINAYVLEDSDFSMNTLSKLNENPPVVVINKDNELYFLLIVPSGIEIQNLVPHSHSNSVF